MSECYANRETLACLIIDDPLLKSRYGFLDYEKLLQAMKNHGFFTEIAFIPWNYKRSDSRIVRLFADNPDYFGLCVHGCNHIIDEFCRGGYQELNDLSLTALWRMEKHKRLTGLAYDPVMVFPGGLFSSVAMQALKDQGFFAAFNSTLRTTDQGEPPVSEYRLPATTMYAGLPLFLRRYPRDRSGFVQDIAAGRPILIGEHHGVFRNGYKEIINLVDWVNSLGRIRWTSLLSITEHYLGPQNVQNPTTNGGSEPPVASTLTFKVKVASTRYLSEIRDNHLDRSALLRKGYRVVRNWYRARLSGYYR